jgi:photosystem II stability/assembly factor-like uncharacterized protein
MTLKKSAWRKLIFALFAAFILSQITFAQTGWDVLRRNSSGDLVSVYFTSSERGWVGGDSGYLAVTTDSGKNWTKQPLSTAENINEIYFRNEETGYLLAGSKIFITKDGGKNWRENIVIKRSDFKGLTPEFLSVRFSDKKRGWIVGSLDNKDGEVMDSLILQTLDSGETWTRVTIPAKQELYHVDFIGDARGWIVGDKGLIYKTEDAGATWVKQISGVTTSLYNIDFRDSDFGTVVGGKGTILRTEDGGATWTKINTTIDKSFLRVNFISDKTGWIVGGGGTILRTDDKGRTWLKQNGQISESLYGLYTDKKNGWAVGKNGIILKYQK